MMILIIYLSPREMNSMEKPAIKDPIKLTFFRSHHHNTSTFLSSCGLRLTFIQMKIQNILHGSRTWFMSSIIFGSISHEMPNRIHQSYFRACARHICRESQSEFVCALRNTHALPHTRSAGHAFWNIYFYSVQNVSEVRRNAFERRKRIMDQHKYNVSTVWRSNRMISANGTSFSRWICEHESIESSQEKKIAEFPYIHHGDRTRIRQLTNTMSLSDWRTSIRDTFQRTAAFSIEIIRQSMLFVRRFSANAFRW